MKALPKLNMSPIYALPLAVAAILSFVVWQRDVQRKPSSDQVNQLEQQVATQEMEMAVWQAKQSLLPIQEAWRVATQAIADCGAEWGIVKEGENLAIYSGPSMAWHGFLKTTTPEHAALCAVYLSEQVDASFNHLMANANGTVISFSVLGIIR